MPISQKKRQKILIIALIAVIIIAGLVLYVSQTRTISKTSKQKALSSMSAREKELKQIKLELEVLDNQLFQSLKSYGVLPVTPGETGKENPFQP